jgi:hypothetical protein
MGCEKICYGSNEKRGKNNLNKLVAVMNYEEEIKRLTKERDDARAFRDKVYAELWKHMDEGEPGELTDESALYLLSAWLRRK